MRERILTAGAGERLLLIGNEAIVRGALEAGVKVATTYPGTPASEIGDTFCALASRAGIAFEYSINEKAAFEVAYGACLGGVRALSSMKHLGLNVAGDPFVTSAYVGTVGGLVVVSAGEPGCHTSPNEQDHRYFARMAYVPVFDPSDPQEALDMTRAAFDLSERWKLPILLRPTTRVSHTQGIVTVGAVQRDRPPIPFVRDPSRFLPVPRTAKVLRDWLIRRAQEAAHDDDVRRFNRVEGSGTDLAIVTSGVSACYVADAVAALGLRERTRILRLGIPYPLDEAQVAEALAGARGVLVVEELEPFIEEIVKKTLFDRGVNVPVRGKASGDVPLAGELTPAIVREAVRAASSGAARKPAGGAARPPAGGLPVRPPILCPGCPHRASFLALKLVAGKDDIFFNDIGCYTLGMDRPFGMGDMLLAMGSGITMGGGFSKTTKQKILAFIGDSTFFHAGTTGLANAVINGHNLLVVILDNGATAMTGHQPSPSDLASYACGGEAGSLSIEAMVRACGVTQVAVIDPADVHASRKTVRDMYARDGVSVVISRHPCPLHEQKEKRPAPAEATVYEVDEELCRRCAQSCGRAACTVEPTREYAFSRAAKRVGSGPAFVLAEGKPPCSEACPAGCCIQGFIARAQGGDLAGAYRIIRRSLPLASILARVCPRPCEEACVRGGFDEAVAVNDIKRFVLDAASEEDGGAFVASLLADVKPLGRRVAVVGSGPAGIAAAWELRLRGYDVTVFEKEEKTGGLLRWGIPRFRLSDEILRRDIDEILSTVTVETGREMGRDFTVDGLLERGYEAVFLGLGAGGGAAPGIEGQDAPGVVQALDFMHAVESGAVRRVEGAVAVVGGGDAALDAARTAVRLGASEVTVVYRRTREDMPAQADEVADAGREGVRFLFQSVPVRIVGNGGGGCTVVIRRTTPGEADASGRRRPVEVPGSETRLLADRVILAVGQEAVQGRGASPAPGLLAVDPVTMMTARKNVFAGGDVVTGPATVVGAVAAGRRAAWGIDVALRGGEAAPLDPGLEKAAESATRTERSFEGVERAARLAPPMLPDGERVRSFEEVRGTFDAGEASREAARCFSCGTCALCDACVSVVGCGAFFVGPDGKLRIDENLCNGCGLCALVCPNVAIRKTSRGAKGAAAGPGQVEAKTVEIYTSERLHAGEALTSRPLRIHFAGVGGQGTLSASGIVGEAAMRAGLNVIIGALHGMAQRGGMVTNQLVIGEARSPIIDAGEADVIAGFEPLETLRSLPVGKEGCVVFMSTVGIVPYTLTVQGRCYPDLDVFIAELRRKASAVISIDAVRVAAQAGNPRAMSAVMIGLMAGAGVFPFPADRLREALADLSPAGRAEQSLRAFDAGMRLAPPLR